MFSKEKVKRKETKEFLKNPGKPRKNKFWNDVADFLGSGRDNKQGYKPVAVKKKK